MSENKPRPKDRVQVSFHADWVGEQDGQRIVDIADGMGPIHVQIPAWASVEVLERADDPFKNPEGTIRREQHYEHGEPAGFSLWQSTLTAQLRSRWLCTYSTAYGNRGEYLDHDDVVGMPVVGAAPGTPAEVERLAEVEHTDQFPPETPPLHVDNEAIVQGQYYANEPEPEDIDLPIPVRQRIAELLVAGDRTRAIRVLRQAVDIGVKEAHRYLKTWAEYQTGLNHRPIADVSLPDVDNEAIVLGEDLAERARQRAAERGGVS